MNAVGPGFPPPADDAPALLVLAARVHGTFARDPAGTGVSANRPAAAHAGGSAGVLAAPRPADTATAVLIREGRIVAVGPADVLAAAAPDAQHLALPGATLTPGLTDAHVHLLEWALSRREAALRGAESPEHAARLVADHAAGVRSAWVRGRGWHVQHWTEPPQRGVLDRAVPDRPVALQSHDMHAMWVNTRALEAAGIDAATADPDGGRIVRDPATGEPTGLLLETAAQLVVARIPPADAGDVDAALLDAQAELHRHGITGVHSFPGVHLREPDPLRTLDEARRRGLLRLRVLQHIPMERLEDAIALGLRSGFGDDGLRIGAVKFFLDGALGSRTAWLAEPYVGTEDRGIQVLSASDFRDAVRQAAEAGLASAVHAIGDAAVALALDVLADSPVRHAALPHRIEHVQLCPPGRLADAGKAGIVCSVQPAHLITDRRAAERHWGVARSRFAFALRSLANLAFGSDAPVEPVDPRLGLFAAVARQDLDGQPEGGWFPEERLTVREAFRGYTLGPAAAAGMADRLGRIEPGALADIAAWDRDPLTCSSGELLALRCVAVIAGGVAHTH